MVYADASIRFALNFDTGAIFLCLAGDLKALFQVSEPPSMNVIVISLVGAACSGGWELSWLGTLACGMVLALD